jgi:hypothetical protein
MSFLSGSPEIPPILSRNPSASRDKNLGMTEQRQLAGDFEKASHRGSTGLFEPPARHSFYSLSVVDMETVNEL